MTATQATHALLRGFDDSRGRVVADCRSMSGYGHEQLLLRPPFSDGVPVPILTLVAEPWCVRLAPVTRAGTELVDVPMIVCLWRPPTAFVDGLHLVTAAGQAAVAAAIRTMPPVNVLVDAGPEVWCGWRLVSPLTDMSTAHAALEQLAARLGGQAAPVDLASWTVPFAGVIRDWNQHTPDLIDIVAADPDRRYTLQQLQQGDLHVEDRITGGGATLAGGARRQTAAGLA